MSYRTYAVGVFSLRQSGTLSSFCYSFFRSASEKTNNRCNGKYYLTLLAEDIADAAHRVDQARLASAFELLAQIAHIDLDNVALAAEVVAPDAIIDHLAREHLLRMAHEQLKQLILFGGQLDPPAAYVRLVRGGIH